MGEAVSSFLGRLTSVDHHSVSMSSFCSAFFGRERRTTLVQCHVRRNTKGFTEGEATCNPVQSTSSASTLQVAPERYESPKEREPRQSFLLYRCRRLWRYLPWLPLAWFRRHQECLLCISTCPGRGSDLRQYSLLAALQLVFLPNVRSSQKMYALMVMPTNSPTYTLNKIRGLLRCSFPRSL